MKFILSSALMLLILSACSSNQELKIESNPPGADIVVVDSTRAPKKVGITPLTLNHENAPQLFSHPIQVNISKEGFKSQSIFVPETTMSAQGQMVIQMSRDDTSLANSTAEGVAEVQRLVFKKKYPEAERILQDILAKSPSIAVLHSLLGNVYYLEKNTSRALESYQRAKALEPGNIEVAKMIEKLRGFHPDESGGGSP